jgi:nucleoside-diphosphate-sugar epimerase
MMQVVVTGAAGFMGRQVVKDLASGGHTVLALTHGMGTVEGAAATLAVDLARSGWSDRLPQAADAVIHLAQSPHYGAFPAHTGDVVAVNIAATAELLDWALRNRVRRVVVASTGSVYQPSEGALVETSATTAGSFYAASKLAAEALAEQYRSLLSIAIVRPFCVYGEQQSRGLFRTLMTRLGGGLEIALAGGIGMRTTPIHVDDAAAMLRRLVECGDDPFEVYNLGGTETVDVREVAKMMAEIGGWQPRFQLTGADPLLLAADSAKLFARTRLQPRIGLAEGIARMLAAPVP